MKREKVKDNKGKMKSIVIKFDCQKCGHDRAWPNRGENNPVYSKKCTRCGYAK